MYIHVVRPGESIYSISRIYGVSPYRIISDNELSNPDRLVVGQTIVIMEGTRRHTVAPGESLYSIAVAYGTTLNRLISYNPQLQNASLIFPGQVILIPPVTSKLGTIEVNGYALPTTNPGVLSKTLPNLTYLSVFSYTVNSDGSLDTINDGPFISAARQAGVAPLMVITNKGFQSDVASAVLNSRPVQDRLMANILRLLQSKNYYGLNIDFEYVYPSDKNNYNDFLARAVQFFGSNGYPVSTALAPKLSASQSGLQYTAHDYAAHGRLVDFTIIMTYEWGFTFGPPMAVAPLNEVRRVLNYAVTEIPPRKLLMGIPNYGYDWTLPYVKGTAATVVSNVGAVDLAARVGAAISYNVTSQAPFFNYYRNGKKHIVWFEDARSIDAKLRLAAGYGIRGVSYWTIGIYFPQNWLVLKSLFNVKKIL